MAPRRNLSIAANAKAEAFAYLRQKQIPFGNDSKKSKGEGFA
jgi:hypothetical protein